MSSSFFLSDVARVSVEIACLKSLIFLSSLASMYCCLYIAIITTIITTIVFNVLHIGNTVFTRLLENKIKLSIFMYTIYYIQSCMYCIQGSNIWGEGGGNSAM